MRIVSSVLLGLVSLSSASVVPTPEELFLEGFDSAISEIQRKYTDSVSSETSPMITRFIKLQLSTTYARIVQLGTTEHEKNVRLYQRQLDEHNAIVAGLNSEQQQLAARKERVTREYNALKDLIVLMRDYVVGEALVPTWLTGVDQSGSDAVYQVLMQGLESGRSAAEVLETVRAFADARSFSGDKAKTILDAIERCANSKLVMFDVLMRQNAANERLLQSAFAKVAQAEAAHQRRVQVNQLLHERLTQPNPYL